MVELNVVYLFVKCLCLVAPFAWMLVSLIAHVYKLRVDIVDLKLKAYDTSTIKVEYIFDQLTRERVKTDDKMKTYKIMAMVMSILFFSSLLAFYLLGFLVV